MYVVTKKGRAAWEAADAAVPDQYRRMLWQIDVQGDQLALNGLRKLYTKALVADWVDELIQLGYLERGKRSDADITVPLDAEAIAAAGEAASQSLSSVGLRGRRLDACLAREEAWRASGPDRRGRP